MTWIFLGLAKWLKIEYFRLSSPKCDYFMKFEFLDHELWKICYGCKKNSKILGCGLNHPPPTFPHTSNLQNVLNIAVNIVCVSGQRLHNKVYYFCNVLFFASSLIIRVDDQEAIQCIHKYWLPCNIIKCLHLNRNLKLVI